jgi:hypothetical protein
VKEGDIETCTYFHLRRFLARDPKWTVLARYFARRTGHYVDLVIFRKSRPRVAIELKWNRTSISDKDRASLNKSLALLKVKKVYALTVLRHEQKYKKSAKRRKEKYRLHEIRIGLKWPREKVQAWDQRRRLLQQKMGEQVP